MNRHILTIFCDDIRHELGGKLSYIGVYSGTMFVSTFPATLPKLCLALNVVSPVVKPFRKLTIRVLKDEEKIADAEFAESDLANALEAAAVIPESERNDRAQAIHALMVFSPFKIDGPCRLRVRADTEEGELRGVGLRIDLAPTQSAAEAKKVAS